MSLDDSAMPTKDYVQDCGPDGSQGPHMLELNYGGFTKRERACIDLRIPESGDAELDALIEKARRQEMAAKAMQGLLASCAGEVQQPFTMSPDALDCADALLAELGRSS